MFNLKKFLKIFTVKINPDELFCSKCLTPDKYFNKGFSWGIDSCPKCNNIICTLYSKLTFKQKLLVKLNG